jgi:hypothetical protein
MPDKALDPVEWELVRADIAVEKARLKANGDWSKWEEFQAQTDARLAAYSAPLGRISELLGLIAPPRRPRRPG